MCDEDQHTVQSEGNAEGQAMISVVIPTYNRSESLKHCLLSLKNQAFKDFEVIVVDDGSTDDTKKAFDSVKDKRFRYFRQSNSGQSAARNNGVRQAKGSIIAFTDDDCEVDPGWLLAVSGSMRGRIKCVKGRTEVLNLNRFTKDLRRYVYTSSSAATNNIAYDKGVIESLGLFDETMRLHEDLDLFYRFRLAGYRKAYDPGMVVFHEYENDIEGFKKVSYNRGIGLRRFFHKFLGIKPSLAVAQVAVAAIPLFFIPLGRFFYLKRLRSIYIFKGFFNGKRIFKIH